MLEGRERRVVGDVDQLLGPLDSLGLPYATAMIEPDLKSNMLKFKVECLLKGKFYMHNWKC